MSDASTVYGDYRIVRTIGRGGMGVVYEAEHVALGRRVALKVLTEDAVMDPVALGRLRREALSMGALQHPHVVQVSHFSEGPPPFLVMELLSGQSLRERLTQGGPMAFGDACLVGVQLLAALEAAHRAGIVHRDVKPANVFVVRTPVTDVFVKLLDFGVAKLLSPQGGPALTHHDAIIGSAPYMAPEQIRGEEIDAKTDVFALGVTLYELLAGRRPFVAGPTENVMVAILRGGPIAPLVGVPSELERVVLRAMQRSPAARYLSANEMMTALLPFVSQVSLSVLATTAMASRSPCSSSMMSTASAAALAPPTMPQPSAPTFAATVDATRLHFEPSPRMHAVPGPHAYGAPVARQPVVAVPGPRGSLGAIGLLAIAGVIVVVFGGRVVLHTVLALRSTGVAPAPLLTGPAGVPAAPAAPVLRGSCEIHPTTNPADKHCTDFFTGDASSLRASFCDPFNESEFLKATWSDRACARRGASFGCRGPGGVTILWTYKPSSARGNERRCPEKDDVLVDPSSP